MFIKIGKRPARFFLKERRNEISEDIVTAIEHTEEKQAKNAPTYKERDLHL
jgi:hypothetical protein